ncbi:MAG: dockerin type I repeat-containing protein [Oscillospiraceae bacterium]|nr:dockerin type I repeat-containing protein [Oscillospiraceae bacterium]
MKAQKKQLALLLALILIVAGFSTLFASAEEVYKRGDVDGNGTIQAADARLALRLSAKLENNLSDTAKTAADFDKSGKVTSSDARTILRISAKLEKHPDDTSSGGDTPTPIDESTLEGRLLKTYTDLMNKAKTEAPGFASYSFMTMPDTEEDREVKKGSIAAGSVFKAFEASGILSDESGAQQKAATYEPNGDMKAFPLYNNAKGCLLTDVSFVKSAEYSVLTNGNAEITLVFKDEKDPKDNSAAGSVRSKTGQVFTHASKLEVGKVLAGKNFSNRVRDINFSRSYHDSKVIIEYNLNTMQIVSLEQVLVAKLNLTCSSLGLVPVEVNQNFYKTTKFYDFDYSQVVEEVQELPQA